MPGEHPSTPLVATNTGKSPQTLCHPRKTSCRASLRSYEGTPCPRTISWCSQSRGGVALPSLLGCGHVERSGPAGSLSDGTPVLLVAALQSAHGVDLRPHREPAGGFAPRFNWPMFAIGLIACTFEEIGWTGCASPHLLARQRSILAGLSFGLIRLPPERRRDGSGLVAGVRCSLTRDPDRLPRPDDLDVCPHREPAAGRADARQLHGLVADTLTVTDYLRDRFKQDKICLMRHPCGSFIAIQAVARAPERYRALRFPISWSPSTRRMTTCRHQPRLGRDGLRRPAKGSAQGRAQLADEAGL